MRIRQVKPAFWSDKVARDIRREDRLTLIGLAMLADSDGYLSWEPDWIAEQLDPFTGSGLRARAFVRSTDRLVRAGLLTLLACGHAFLPNADLYTDLAPIEPHECGGPGRRRQPERAIEDRLYAFFTSGDYWLVERQVRLGPGAIADLIVGTETPDGDRQIVVIEVKAVPAGDAALKQVERYVALAKARYQEPTFGLVMAPRLTASFRPEGGILGAEVDKVALDG